MPTRKNPTILHGKELYEIHFDPFYCALAPIELLKKEIEPLFTYAAKKALITKKEAELYSVKIPETKNPEEIWEKVIQWHGKINPHAPDGSNALAAWYVLLKLQTARNIWNGLKRPYTALFQLKTYESILENVNKALLLASTFEHLDKVEENDKEKDRHLLALILLLKKDPEEVEKLCRETLRGESFIKINIPKVFIVCYGAHMENGHGAWKENRWVRAPLQTIKNSIEKEKVGLTHEQREIIKNWETAKL